MNPQQIVQLQRSIGNLAVQRMLKESSLVDRRIGAAEGARVALAPDGDASEEQHPIPQAVEDFLQAKATGRGPADAPSVQAGDLESRLGAAKGGGSALPGETLAFMEPRFGFDFGAVRVHRDASAVQMNRQLGSQAFAHGSDLYFDEGKFDPSSDSGKWLLAHELTHVVQQTGGIQTKLTVGAPDDVYEREADSVANRVMQMGSPDIVASAPASPYPAAYLDFIKGDGLAPSTSPATDGSPIQWACASCEAGREADRSETVVARSAVQQAQPLRIEAAPPSIQRGFFMGPCIAEHWNLVAAIASLVAAAGAEIALILAPDPTTISKWVAVGAVAGVIAGIAWTVNAVIALHGCLSADPVANKAEMEGLERRLRQLEAAQRRMQELQSSPPTPDGGARPAPGDSDDAPDGGVP